jgi:parallel beta-helix repeat protein
MTEILKWWPCWLLAAALALAVGIAVAMAGGTVEAQPGTEYYVDAASGNDTSGDGTELNPWKTITHAVNTVPAGNESYLRTIAVLPTGTYDEANGEVFPIVLDEEWVHVLGTETVTSPGGIPDLAQNGTSWLLQPRTEGYADVVGNGTGALFRIEAPFTGIFSFNLSNATCGVEATCGNFEVADNDFSTEAYYDIEYGVYINIVEVDRTTDFVFGGFTADEEETLIYYNDFYVTAAGVYVNLDLDFDASQTGLSATIGDIEVSSNDFYMATTEGVSLNVTVADVSSGNVTIGSVDIGDADSFWKGNSFHRGTCGVHFDGRLENLDSTTVTVDQILVGNNDFYDQTDAAVFIDYYDSAHSGTADGWYGTEGLPTEIDFGPVAVVDNGIDSAQSGCDGIVVNFANWEYLEGEVSVMAQGIEIVYNDLYDSVPGYGIHVHYGPLRELSGDPKPYVEVGMLEILGNDVHTTSASDGIYVHYDHCAQSVSAGRVDFGDAWISNNRVDAGLDGVHVYYEECGSNMATASVAFGALHITRNDITAASDGVYVHHYNTHGLDGKATVSWGRVTIEDNYAVQAGDNGIYLHYDNVGQDMWYGARVYIGDVLIGDNEDVAAGLDGVYVHYHRVGYYEFMSGAEVTVGDLDIGGNYIGTDSFPVGDQGVEVYYNECGYYQENDSVVTFGDVACDMNTIYAGKDGVLTQYTDFGYYLNDTAQTAAGSLTMEENTINANKPLYLSYSGVACGCNATVVMDDVCIGGNTLSGDNEGIDIDYVNGTVAHDMHDGAYAELPSFTITGNTVNVGGDGVCFSTEDNPSAIDGNATVDFGGMLIDDNTFNDEAAGMDDGIFLLYDDFCSGCVGNSTATMGYITVANNRIYGCGTTGITAYLWSGITVDCNTIRDSAFTGVNLLHLSHATITDNLLLDNGSGIYLYDCDAIDIQHNDILYNQIYPTSYGVSFDGDCGGANTVNYNNIVANAEYGVSNEGVEVVNAEYNWWGNASGPYHPTANPGGSGDPVSDNVYFDPWLGQSYVSPYQQVATATGAGNATIQTDGGAIVDFQAVEEESLPEEGKPDLAFDYGFFSFKVIGLEPGQGVTVTLTLPGTNVTAGSLYWKHGPTLGNSNDHWFSLPLGDNDGDEVITIDLTDGEDGDLDVTQNSEILEPGGPGTSPSAPIPGISLPSWGGLPIGTPTPQPDEGNSTAPAEFEISSLQVSPAEVQPNEAVNVSFDVSNVGGSYGSYEAVLYVDGESEGSQQVSVAAGETKGASFAVSKAEPGDYEVSVGEETGWFTVVGAQVGGGGLGAGAIAGIVIAAVVVLGLAAFLVVRRLRPAA